MLILGGRGDEGGTGWHGWHGWHGGVEGPACPNTSHHYYINIKFHAGTRSSSLFLFKLIPSPDVIETSFSFQEPFLPTHPFTHTHQSPWLTRQPRQSSVPSSRNSALLISRPLLATRTPSPRRWPLSTASPRRRPPSKSKRLSPLRHPILLEMSSSKTKDLDKISIVHQNTPQCLSLSLLLPLSRNWHQYDL